MLTLTSNLERKRSSLAVTNPAGALEAVSREGACVRIEYCAPGNHESVARELARAISEDCGEEAVLVPSRDGVFEVTVAGNLIFSKRASWRFPEHDEILYHVRQVSAA